MSDISTITLERFGSLRRRILGNAGNKQYAVVPGETVPVYYNGNGGPLEITGPKYHDMFNVNGCYLDHNGNTGRAVLNDPADGDIQFYN